MTIKKNLSRISCFFGVPICHERSNCVIVKIRCSVSLLSASRAHVYQCFQFRSSSTPNSTHFCCCPRQKHMVQQVIGLMTSTFRCPCPGPHKKYVLGVPEDWSWGNTDLSDSTGVGSRCHLTIFCCSCVFEALQSAQTNFIIGI